jgi:hypothetical protein
MPTKEVKKAMLAASSAMSMHMITTMRAIKVAIKIILFLLCRVFMMELAEMYHPKKRRQWLDREAR